MTRTKTGIAAALALVLACSLSVQHAQAAERSRSRHHRSQRIREESAALDDLDSRYGSLSLDDRMDTDGSEWGEETTSAYGEDMFEEEGGAAEEPRFLEMEGLLDNSGSDMNPPPEHQKSLDASGSAAEQARFRSRREGNSVDQLLKDALGSDSNALDLSEDSGSSEEGATDDSRLSTLEGNVRSLVSAVQLNRKLYMTLRQSGSQVSGGSANGSAVAISRALRKVSAGVSRLERAGGAKGGRSAAAEGAEAAETIESFERAMDRSFDLMDRGVQLNGHSFKEELEGKLNQVLQKFEARAAAGARR